MGQPILSSWSAKRWADGSIAQKPIPVEEEGETISMRKIYIVTDTAQSRSQVELSELEMQRYYPLTLQYMTDNGITFLNTVRLSKYALSVTTVEIP